MVRFRSALCPVELKEYDQVRRTAPAGGRTTTTMRMKIVIATAVLVVAMASVTPAFAQYVGGNPPAAGTSGQPAEGKSIAPASVRVSGPAATRRSGGVAFTGADIMQLVLVGGAFVVAGAVLTTRSRRRSAEHALS